MSEEEIQIPVSERNREVVQQFSDRLVKGGYAEKAGVDPERCGETMDLFQELREMWVDPNTREKKDPKTGESMALAKAMRIAEIARERLGIPEGEEVDGKRVRILQKMNEGRGIMTYNVVVTLGNPSTGPNVYLDAHFDSVAREEKERALSYNEEGDNKNPMIIGSAVQDNAIHLAAALEALGHINVPESGAIHIVSDDHEENGIVGGEVIAEDLLAEASKDHPIIHIANESTERKFIFAHRGKDKDTIVSDKVGEGNIGNAAIEFYRILTSSQQSIYDESRPGESKLGPTAGTSVYGNIGKEGIYAIYDIRTNEKAGVNTVRGTFSELFTDPNSPKRLPDSELISKALKARDKGNFEIRATESGIEITADGAPHPSNFNPENDDTAMSGVFLALASLDDETRAKVESVSWGDENKQNSNPMQATIKFSEGSSLTQQELDEAIENLKKEEKTLARHEVNMQITADQNTVTIDTVVSPEDGITEEIRKIFSDTMGQEIQTGTVGYMTSNGPIYNLAKAQGREVYAYVIGTGNLTYVNEEGKETGTLHSLKERVSTEDVAWLVKAQEGIVNAAYKVVSKKTA